MFGQNGLRNHRQKSKMAATKFSFFVISTSDRGDFPRIIVIALFVLKGALKKDIPVFWLNQKYFCQFFSARAKHIKSIL